MGFAMRTEPRLTAPETNWIQANHPRTAERPLQAWARLLSVTLARCTAATIFAASGNKALERKIVGRQFSVCFSQQETQPLVKDRVKDRDGDIFWFAILSHETDRQRQSVR